MATLESPCIQFQPSRYECYPQSLKSIVETLLLLRCHRDVPLGALPREIIFHVVSILIGVQFEARAWQMRIEQRKYEEDLQGVELLESEIDAL